MGGLVGARLGAAYLSARIWGTLTAPAGGLGAGMLFHSIHNLGASLSATTVLTICLSFLFDWSGILMLDVLVALIWRQEKGWMAEHGPRAAS